MFIELSKYVTIKLYFRNKLW